MMRLRECRNTALSNGPAPGSGGVAVSDQSLEWSGVEGIITTWELHLHFYAILAVNNG